MLLWGISNFPRKFLQAQEEIETKIVPEKKENAKIEVNFQDNSEAEQAAASNSSILRNPAIANTLNLGTNLLNRSTETLMEVLFYSILDQKMSSRLTRDLKFETELRRDLISLPNGSYVVVDKFLMVLLMIAYSLPYLCNCSPGIDGRVGLQHIYVRNDAMRAINQKTLPWYRSLLNNWFGILPLLTGILPPSFNPNELYDPINVPLAPFTFSNKL